MPSLEGQTLKGRYRVEQLLGRGGMAEVYKALDTRRQHHVALKIMRPNLAGDAEFLERFRVEAETLAALSHANVIRFYGFEREGRLAFIVMDYVAGVTLRDRLRAANGSPMPLGQAAAVVRQVCAALHYAHAEGVLHLDVKPGNIILRPDGQVFVADFGIAQVAGAAGLRGSDAGTAAYMSPEQCQGGRLDTRSDVYSLGVVAYEMLAGRRPFVGETAPPALGDRIERVRWEQVNASPPPLSRRNPAVSPALEAAVQRTLAKDPDRRFPSAMSFARAFDTALGSAEWRASAPEAPSAQPPVPGPATPEPAVSAPAVRAGERVGKLPPQLYVLGGIVLVVLVVLLLALSAGRGGGTLPSAESTRLEGTRMAVPATFELCVEPARGDFGTTFYVTVAGWDVRTAPRYRFSLTRPDGKQTWEQQLPTQLDQWSCGGAAKPGFRFGITPEENEMPGTWEVMVEALPAGGQATVSFVVTR